MEKDLHPYRILVVEDNPGDFTLIEEYLLEHIQSPSIHLATSYARAAEYLVNAAPFEVVFLDLSLPDREGRGLIESILALVGNVPVIVLTGYPDFSLGIESVELGVSDYLLKDELNAFSLYKSLVYNIERKKNLKALRESERQYSDLFHLSPQPMWVYNVENFRFIDVNNAAMAQYGYSRQEFMSMHIFEILPQEDYLEAQAMVNMARAVQKLAHQAQYRHRKKNGEIFQVEVQSTVITLADMKAEIVLAIDVNERHAYIEQIEKQNEALRDIAWIQSHMVRSPLSRILGVVELISKINADDDDFVKLIEALDFSAKELDVVIRQISEKSTKIDFGDGTDKP